VHVTPTSAFANTPTARMLAGDFSLIASAQCNNGRTITLPAPFVGNTISPALFSRAALNVTSRLPTGPDPCGRITFDRKNDSNEKIIVGRADYQWTANHSLFGRYQLADFNSDSDFDGSNFLSSTASPIDNAVHSVVLGDSLIFGSNTVNSIRATYNSTKIFKPGNDTFDFQDVGIKSTVLLPDFIRIGVAGGFNLGGTVPGSTPSKSYQFSDDLSMVRGSHQFGVGMNYIHDESHGIIYQMAVGNFQFTGQATGLGLADFLLGRPNGFSLGSITRSYMHYNYIGSYVQDTWRVNPRVTLNAGIRWDPYFPPTAATPTLGHFEQDRFDKGLRSTKFPTGPAGMIFQGDPEFLSGDAAGFRQWNDWAPRVALVIDPQGDGRSSIRTAYGRFYDSPQGFSFNGYASALPNGVNLTSTTATLDDPWGQFPGGDPFPVVPGPNMTFPNFGIYVTAPFDQPASRADQWNVSYQRQLGTNWAASANFLINHGRHLPVSNETNPSTFIPGTCGAAACSTTANANQRRRLFLQNPTLGSAYADLVEVVNIGRSNYKGLLLSLQRRSTTGLSVQGNYTLSKCDSDRLEMAAGGTIGATPLTRPNNLDADYGSCGPADRRHVVNASVVYQTPSSPGVLGALTGDWQFSGIVQGQSGNYFSVVTGVDNALNKVATTPTQRPTQILDDPYLKQGYRWLNPAAFQAPAPGTYGTMPFNAIVGPGRFNVDAGVVRSFRVRGQQELQFRGEVFNLFNRTQLGVPELRMNQALFGLITAAGDPRIAQLALKYSF
jgi:outer membrane receptor protein involved in Fe transport